MNRLLTYIIGGVAGVLLLGVGVWFMFFRTPAATLDTSGQQQTFPTTPSQSNVPVSGTQTQGSTNGQLAVQGLDISKKIFKVADGPVAGATLLQMSRPTTTVARYVMADTGRVFEVALDSAGAVARAVSNTTIPGLMRAQWAEGGAAVVGQYLDAGSTKTIYLGFPTSTSTLSKAVKIQFLPDEITDYAISPDGKSVAYLLKSAGGTTGYVAKSDGTQSKKLFSLPLSQVLLSWPSSGVLLAQSPSAAGIAGIAFSVDAKSGTVSPLLYANGLSAAADRAFSRVVYQVTEAASRSTYLHEVKSNTDRPLSFDPFPENCAWSNVASTSFVTYCFLPLAYVPANYLDLWHLGAAAVADSIFKFDASSGRSTILATPGSSEGGASATIAAVALSPDDKYLLYITKGDRALYGVRLGN